MSHEHADIARYYDYTLPYYDNFWHGHTNAVHYGFADETTVTHHDELINTNRFLARAAAIEEGERVLDAGCGIGGSALWLAQTFGATVHGVTLSPRQVRRARSIARRNGCESHLSFEQADVLLSGLPDASFDVVWALESACYLLHSEALFREAYRLLRPGGRFVIGDGFSLRMPTCRRERRWVSQFLEGLVLPGLTPIGDPPRRMSACGFVNVRAWNQTEAIRGSALRLARASWFAYALSLIGQRLRLSDALLTRNSRAGIAQYELVIRGVLGYGVVVGTKPARVDS